MDELDEVQPDLETPDPVVVDDGKTEQPKPDDVAVDAEKAKIDEGKVDPDAKLVPGTPDKALQKVQQDTAANKRLLEELNAKIEAGKPLTPKEARKLDKVRDFLKAKDTEFNIDTGREVAESLVETDDRVTALEKLLAEQREELRQSREAFWYTTQETKYPGVDIEAVYKKAWDDARETLGEDVDVQIVKRLAAKNFNDRASAATKRIAAAEVAGANRVVTAKPGSAKTSVATTIRTKEALSADDEMMRDAMMNVKEE